MRVILRNIFTMFILLGAASNVCATLIIESNLLIGATNVDVDGTFYNVEFVDRSCVSLLNGCDNSNDFQFNTLGSANSASQALLALFEDAPFYDNDPTKTWGCVLAFRGCFLWTFYGFEVNAVALASVAINYAGNATNIVGVGGNTGAADDFTGVLDYTVARWTPATSVPEPSTIAIFALGIMGLASRRFKKQP